MAISLTVFGIPNYLTCYETFGMAVTEEIVRTVSEALRSANPNAQQTARISEDEFTVLYAADSEEVLSMQLQKSTEEFFGNISDYNAYKEHAWQLEVNFGYTKLAPNWSGILLENLIHLALGEMYLNRLRANLWSAM